MGKKKDVWEFEIPVEFGSVSAAKTGNSVGLKIAVSDMHPTDAEEIFVGAQLDLELECDPNAKDDAKGQQTMEVGTLKFAGVGEVKGYRRSVDGIGVTVRFPGDVDYNVFCRFHNCKGTMRCTKTGEIPTEGDGGEEGEES